MLSDKNYKEQELIDILNNLEKQKAQAIKNQQYELAAQLRDEQKHYREQLNSLLNLKNS